MDTSYLGAEIDVLAKQAENLQRGAKNLKFLYDIMVNNPNPAQALEDLKAGIIASYTKPDDSVAKEIAALCELIDKLVEIVEKCMKLEDPVQEVYE